MNTATITSCHECVKAKWSFDANFYCEADEDHPRLIGPIATECPIPDWCPKRLKAITGTVFGSRTTGIETYRLVIDAYTAEQFKPGDRVTITREG